MQEGVATLLARCDCDRDVVPEACLPDRRVAKRAVPQYVDDAGGHAAIILRLIAVDPAGNPKQQRQQKMRARVLLDAFEHRTVSATEQPADLTKHRCVGVEDPFRMRCAERAYVIEGDDRRLPVQRDLREPVEIHCHGQREPRG